MRIAHVTPAFPPYLSGVSTTVLGLARAGASLGHEVHVFTGRRGEAARVADDPPDLTVHRLPALFRIGNAPFVPGLVRLRGFDVIHLHYPWYFGAELLWLGLLTSRTPMLATYHHDVVFAGALATVDALHRRTLSPLILRRAKLVTTATMEYARNSSLRRQMRGRWERVVELGFPIDTAQFAPGPPHPDLSRRIAGPGMLLVFVAALDRAHYHKGLGALLGALARPEVPTARLMVVGDGEDRPGYERQARELGLESRVLFLGRQSQDGLIAALRTSDALILPSETQSEAFGMVVLEAMACGKPAIVSDLPGLRTLPPQDDGPLTISPPLTPDQLADRLAALQDPQRRRRLGEKARELVMSRYDTPVIARRLGELYEATLGAQPLPQVEGAERQD